MSGMLMLDDVRTKAQGKRVKAQAEKSLGSRGKCVEPNAKPERGVAHRDRHQQNSAQGKNWDGGRN